MNVLLMRHIDVSWAIKDPTLINTYITLKNKLCNTYLQYIFCRKIEVLFFNYKYQLFVCSRCLVKSNWTWKARMSNICNLIYQVFAQLKAQLTLCLCCNTLHWRKAFFRWKHRLHSVTSLNNFLCVSYQQMIATVIIQLITASVLQCKPKTRENKPSKK